MAGLFLMYASGSATASQEKAVLRNGRVVTGRNSLH